jgi:hypothetical protein
MTSHVCSKCKDVLDAPEHQGMAKHLKLDTRFAQLVSVRTDARRKRAVPHDVGDKVNRLHT